MLSCNVNSSTNFGNININWCCTPYFTIRCNFCVSSASAKKKCQDTQHRTCHHWHFEALLATPVHWGTGMRVFPYLLDLGPTVPPSSRTAMLFHTEPGSSEYLQHLEVERHLGVANSESRPRPNWKLVGSAWGVLHMLEWPTQPHWLTSNDSWSKNGKPPHSKMWPDWWDAKLLWLRIDPPHTMRSLTVYEWRGSVQSSNPPSNSSQQDNFAGDFDWFWIFFHSCDVLVLFICYLLFILFILV